MSALPSGWASAPLRTLGIWIGGGTPSKTNSVFWSEGTLPWVSPKDMKVNIIRDSEDHITDEAVAASATNLVPKGTVLVVTRSGILRHSLPVAVTGKQVSLNQDLKALTPARGLSPHYIAWSLRSQAQKILQECAKGGTTVQSIETNRLLDFEIPIAPAAEQERIVAAIEEQLSRLDTGVAALQRVRQNLKRLRSAVMEAAVHGLLVPQKEQAGEAAELAERLQAELAAVRSRRKTTVVPIVDVTRPASWQLVSVSDLAESITYGTSNKSRADIDGIPVLRMGNLGWDNVSYQHLKYLSHDDADDRLLLERGDLLFNRTNSAELVGKTAVFHGYHEPISFASYLIRVRPLPSASMSWVSLVMNSSVGRRYVASVRSQQVGQANVNGTKLASAPIPLPGEAEQQCILRERDRYFSLIADLEAALDIAVRRSAHIRSSTLTAALSGQLVPQDSNDEPASVLLERLAAERASTDGNNRAKARIQRRGMATT